MVEFIAPILTGDVAGDGHGRHRADYFKFTVPVETEEEARQALKASYEKSELQFGAIGNWEAENGMIGSTCPMSIPKREIEPWKLSWSASFPARKMN